MKEKIKNIGYKIATYLSDVPYNKKKQIFLLVLILLVVNLFVLTTSLYAQGGGMQDMWETVKSIIGGPLGKTIAALGFVGGVVLMFFGQWQWGIMAIGAALLIAFAPAIIDLIFGG